MLQKSKRGSQVTFFGNGKFCSKSLPLRVNPGTPDGLKLYNKATAAPDLKISIEQSKATDIKCAFESDANDFGWGPAVGAVQVDNARTTRNILSQAREITLEHVQKLARYTWDALAGLVWSTALLVTFTVGVIDPAAHAAQRPQFLRRTRSVMIAKRIAASLDKDSLTSLMFDKQNFSWTEPNGTVHYDGSTMLWLTMSKINPSIRVGISTLKTSLVNSTLPSFKHDVAKLLDLIQEQYTRIYADGGVHTDYTHNLYNALESANNGEFLAFVCTEKDKWETSTVTATDRKTSSALRIKVLQKYNNILLAHRWKKTEYPSVKIISVLTALVTSTSTTKKSNPKLRIPEWRTEKKGSKVDRDGKTWWWCPHHKAEGLFDGLYVTHKPEDYDEWKQNKKNFKKNKILLIRRLQPLHLIQTSSNSHNQRNKH